jgi:hypothetical protein
MNVQGMQYSRVLEFSAGSDLIVYGLPAITAAGGFSGLAAVLVALFHKCDGKKWTFKAGGREFSAEGCSLEDAKSWIRATLEVQAEIDKRWEEIKKGD